MKRLLLNPVLFFLCIGQQIDAAQTSDQTEPTATISQQANLSLEPKFSANLALMEKRNSANESFWLDINEHKTLVLKHWARGKVLRGDLILLHAQSENADHGRLVNPLAQHFSQRGWHVYVPNLPIEDYPKIQEVALEVSTSVTSNDQASQTDPNQTDSNQQPAVDNSNTQDNSDNANQSVLPPKNHYFDTEQSYQTFISQLLNNLTANIQPKSDNLLVVANQNSAFWILESAKTNSSFNQLALIHPQIPHNFDKNLDEYFSGQTLPVFAFFKDVETESEFINAFDRQLWRSRFQRINRGTFSDRGIEEENPQIAKLIIGWVTRIQKEN
ncbi:DUF3530 family protein [Aliikangiella marina]|uniref:DUF3530 family protein n=1 Tax=Aliikangiella marina TaxID=1712262 RepID=A0A545T956_9GAMM|nr:DUF3530 family protein [Aliikangiella marina]TQV73751.1 DUF3530 family protein [Aliikangiella marina]